MLRLDAATNSVIRPPENKQGDSSQKFELPESVSIISSKSKLKHLMANGSLNKKTEEVKSSTSNLVNHQKASLESSQKDHFLTRTYQSTEVDFQDKTAESTKNSNKPHQPKVGSQVKNRLSKLKTLQINTNYTIQTSQELFSNLKASSAKNGSCLDNSSPSHNILYFDKENRFNPCYLKPSYPQSVKNSSSQVLEYLNTKMLSPISCSHKLLMQGSNQALSNDINHDGLTLPPDALLKMLNPQRAKPKEERVDEATLNNLKSTDTRSNSCRKRRSNQIYEQHDEPTSKLSTKAPSQFSEIQRSFPSQKSRSIIKQDTPDHVEDDGKDASSGQKIQNSKIEAFDGKRLAVKNTKGQYSGKENHYNPLKQGKNKGKGLINFLDFRSKDNLSFGSILKALHEQKQSENIPKKASRESKKSQESINTNTFEKKGTKVLNEIQNNLKSNQNNKSNKTNQTKERKSKISEKKKLTGTQGVFNTPSARDSGSIERLEEKEMVQTYCMTDNDLQSDDKKIREFGYLFEKQVRGAYAALKSPAKKTGIDNKSGDESLVGRIVLDMVKRNDLEEIKQNPKAKFLMLRKQIQGKRVLRKARSFELPTLPETATSNKEEFVHADASSVERDAQNQSNTKSLNEIFLKTKKMLEVYQEREKAWFQEKKVLLERIQNLESGEGVKGKAE